jgi:hypothetical protein
MSFKKEISLFKTEFEKQQQEIRQRFPEVAQASESILKIVKYKDGKPIGQGSCIAVEGNHVLTAFHVVKGADQLLLYHTGNELNLATNFGGDTAIDPELDVAALALPEVYESIVPLGRLGSCDYSDSLVFLAGFPRVDEELDWPLYGQQAIIQRGKLYFAFESKLAMLIDGSLLKVMKGVSGGAVVNCSGEVIGIAKGSKYDPDIGFSVLAISVDDGYSSLFPQA